MREADIHPCFSCALRRALAVGRAAQQGRRPQDERTRVQFNIGYRELYSIGRNARRRRAAAAARQEGSAA